MASFSVRGARVSRLVSGLSRAGVALAVFLLALGVLRWRPVYAEPPWDVRAMPMAAAAVLLAIPAAIFGRERRPRRARPAALAAVAVAGALLVVVLARGPGGVAAEAADQRGPVGTLAPGPIDVLGADLRSLAPAGRRLTLRWQGELRAPQSGTYRLWATGRGDVKVSLDGRVVLTGGGEVLRAGADTFIGRGPHRLEVQLDRVGPGPRLRLGWTRPGGRVQTIPPRLLGPEPGR